VGFFNKNDPKHYSHIAALMEKHDYDESKYIQSLDLNSVRTNLFYNLETSVRNINKVAMIKAQMRKQREEGSR